MMIFFFLIKTYVVMKKKKAPSFNKFWVLPAVVLAGHEQNNFAGLTLPLGRMFRIPAFKVWRSHAHNLIDEVLVPASAHVVVRDKWRQMIIFTSHTPWFPFCPAAGLKRTLRPQILKGPLICHRLGKYGRVNDFPVSLVAADLRIACCLLLSQKE